MCFCKNKVTLRKVTKTEEIFWQLYSTTCTTLRGLQMRPLLILRGVKSTCVSMYVYSNTWMRPCSLYKVPKAGTAWIQWSLELQVQTGYTFGQGACRSCMWSASQGHRQDSGAEQSPRPRAVSLLHLSLNLTLNNGNFSFLSHNKEHIYRYYLLSSFKLC